MPKPLDVNRLKQFETRAPARDLAAPENGTPGEFIGRWPSREPVMDGQISIKAPLDVLDRFRRLCKDDRRTYADMLAILMDLYESKG